MSVTPALGKRRYGDRRISGVFWPASLAELMSSRFRETSSQKHIAETTKRAQGELCPSQVHTQVHMHIHKHKHIYGPILTPHLCLKEGKRRLHSPIHILTLKTNFSMKNIREKKDMQGVPWHTFQAFPPCFCALWQ